MSKLNAEEHPNVNDRAIFPYTGEDALEFTARVEPSLKIMNYTGFADMNITPPEIEFDSDYEQYYHPARNMIHIGVYGLIERYKPEDEADYFNALNYVRGHEEQHRRSTSKAYAAAIIKGCETIVEYISSQVDTFKRKFRRQSDYETYCNVTLPSMGVYISWDMVRGIVGYLVNALEDGRIERLRSNRFPGFAALRTLYRGRDWMNMDLNFKPYDDIKDDYTERLMALLNEIRSLSTCQLYDKGFAKTYVGTPMIDEVKAFMPYIASAVMSGSCRGLFTPAVEICKLLAPYIYETCKISAEDYEARNAFEQFLKDLLKSMLDNLTESCVNESSEDTDDGSANSAMPMSDLQITVSDEVYDKLKENTNDSSDDGGNGNGGGGLMIKREHPEEDKSESSGENGGGQDSSQGENSEETKPGKNSGQGNGGSEANNRSSSKGGENGEDKTSGGAGNGQDSSQGGNSEETKSGKNAGQGNGGSEANNRSSSKGDEGGKDKTSGGAGNGQDSSQGENSKEAKSGKNTGKGKDGPEANGSSPTGSSDGKNSSGQTTSGKAEKAPMPDSAESTSRGNSLNKAEEDKHVSKDIRDKAAAAVEKAMANASERTRAEAATVLTNVNASTVVSSRSTSANKEVRDFSKPVSPEEMKDICDFEELKRKYKVTDNLPAVLAQRGKILKRKNEQYFKSLSTPNVSYLDSGSIDPSRIYGLAMGDTEIFRKKGKDKKFDGCAYILIDNSGSMYGTKRMEACKAAAVIEEGFKGIMPFKIVAFDYYGTVIHEVIKGWDESLNKNCCWNFALHGRDGCGNEDGYDVQVAERELLARPERKKMLIVLSDGTPGNPSYCKEAIAHCRKNGISVHGIYFEEGDCCSNKEFEYMYQKDYICCPLGELDEHLNRIFKKFSRS